MNERKLNSTTYPYLFFLNLSSDHITGATGLTPAVTLSKNGGAFAAAAGSVTEVGNGWYALAGNAADRNTLGALAVHVTASGADPFDGKMVVVPWDPFDPNLALVALPSAAPGAANGLPVLDGSQHLLVYSVSQPVTAGTVSDKTGYALTAAEHTAVQADVQTGMTAQGYTAARGPKLDNLDAAVSTRSTFAGGAVASVTGNVGGNVVGSVGSVAGNVAGSVASVAGAVTVGTNNDKTGYALSSGEHAALATALFTDVAAGDLASAPAGSPGHVLSQLGGAFTGTGSVFSAAALANAPAGGGGGGDPFLGSETTAYSAGTWGAFFKSMLDTNVGSRGTSTYAGGAVASVTAPVTVGTNQDKAGYALASGGLDAVSVESGVNARQALSVVLASAAGVLSGANTPTVVVQGGNVATTRITATVDGSGNRTAVALSLPS